MLRERDDAERVVDLERERVVGCWSLASPRVEDSLCLGLFRDGAVRAHLAAVHHESEAREVLFEQPCSELEISARLEEESCVVSVQPLAKRAPASPVLRPHYGQPYCTPLPAALAKERLANAAARAGGEQLPVVCFLSFVKWTDATTLSDRTH
jgi:hypothetical protein